MHYKKSPYIKKEGGISQIVPPPYYKLSFSGTNFAIQYDDII